MGRLLYGVLHRQKRSCALPPIVVNSVILLVSFLDSDPFVLREEH